jgi:transcriptional regulator GlxA family with amidase domain
MPYRVLFTRRRATSNKAAWGWVTSLSPKVDWVRKARWVHDGPFLTSSGVTAGTDAAVYAVKVLLSPQEASAAAKRLEHLPVVDEGADPFADEQFVPEV